jgi:hypothetical protein
VELAYDCTQGQPWLVNALAREITVTMRVPPSQPVTAGLIEAARERLILARPVHLDSLAAGLSEPRVQRVIDPLIAGGLSPIDDAYDDDLSYARDVGLIAPARPIRIANPVYEEVIVRVLGDSIEDSITTDPYSLILPDGRLDVDRMLEEFTDFWLANGEWMASDTGYNEAGAQIVFMAFLQRMIDGDGFVDREFGLGRDRADILIRRPYGNGLMQRAAFELMVWKDGRPDPLARALSQLDKYLARLRHPGHLRPPPAARPGQRAQHHGDGHQPRRPERHRTPPVAPAFNGAVLVPVPP